MQPPELPLGFQPVAGPGDALEIRQQIAAEHDPVGPVGVDGGGGLLEAGAVQIGESEDAEGVCHGLIIAMLRDRDCRPEGLKLAP